MAIKSKVVSWLGVLLGIMTELYKKVVKLGGSDEHFHFLATPEAEDLLEQIANLIRWGGEEFGEWAFRVEVDYGATLAELLAKKPIFNKVDERLGGIRYEPWPGKKSEATVVLFCLAGFEDKGTTWSDESARAELRKRGYRAASLEELIPLAERNDVLPKLGDFPPPLVFSLADGMCPNGNEDEVIYPVLALMGHEGKALLARNLDEEKDRQPLQCWIAAVPDRK